MLTSGTFLGSRYEIIDKIGAGGMSNVYKAKDHSLGRDVAIKVLKSEFADDSSFVTKFKAEAQSAASLEHPNIVNIYDVGSENGNYYIVMEYVEGITLKTYINKKGHLGYNEVLSIAIQVGRGIEAAHNKGIVHRDIKPQNIIISKEGKVKVTDFGIARAATSNTIHADLMGSVHYSSPEQARNGFVNYQSDIYSLGIVMYEMSTGKVPFDGDTTVAVAIQHLQSEMIPPSQIVSDVPIAVERIILKATMKSPDRRYATIGDLLTDLKKALVNPDENFVIIPEVGEVDKTKVILPEELTRIQEAANAAPTPVSEPAKPRKQEPQVEYDEEEEEDEEGGVNPKIDKVINIVGIVVAVIIVLILIYVAGSIFGLFKFGPAKHEEPQETEKVEETGVEVPNLLNMTESEAKAALKGVGLGFDVIGEMASEEYEEGHICEQDPVSGDKVEENTTIKVKISSGAGDIEIPKVVGAKLEEAVETLKKAGFDYNPTYEYSDTVPQGQVISQTPKEGESGKKGDTITLTVSQGVETMQVPDVRGKSQSEA
nr:Stk1 family PASTA domain-containing Ser/Thr kinase [Lachnospiraceae bacterium]